MIENIYERTKFLSKTCLKIAMVIPKDIPLSSLAKEELVKRSSLLAIKSKGLMVTQNPDFFLQKLNDAREAVDGCHFWLDIIHEEGWIKKDILKPILEECDEISQLFGMAIKKIKPNG